LTGTEQIEAQVRRGEWTRTYERLGARDATHLAGDDLDALADAAWWLCRPEESIAARQRAYAAHVAANAVRPSAHAAWRLFYDHLYGMRPAVALGWAAAARRLLENEDECAEHGYLAFAEAELALHKGTFREAKARAGQAVEIGRRYDEQEVVAMALQIQGQAELGLGEVERGTSLLDEAMCFVLAGQLSEMFAGWVYCGVLVACLELADLGRAGEWTEAATTWCDSLPARTPYHGLCRIYRGEVLGLRGAWAEAEREIGEAAAELLAHKPYAAAAAFDAVGEIRRRRGDIAGAEEAFSRAAELGHEAQPGMALVRLAQGRADSAGASLAAILANPRPDGRARGSLLAAGVEVWLAAGDLDMARQAGAELTKLADELNSAALQASAGVGRAALELADGDAATALAELHHATAIWMELELPYECARTRLMAGAASAKLGDAESARLALESARATFSALGAETEAREAARLLDEPKPPPGGLTPREIEVLRLVATGMSNREIARELVISEHTVARHLQNVFARLDVSSRTAATAFALEHELI
jgi:DNA-binding NarL/FixJ family response regulator